MLKIINELMQNKLLFFETHKMELIIALYITIILILIIDFFDEKD